MVERLELNPTLKPYAKRIARELLSPPWYSRTFYECFPEVYERIPVPPREFFTDNRFFGASLRELHPLWLDELDWVCSDFTPINEWLLGGAIGVGKTTAAMGAIAYRCIYYLTCLRDPAKYFDLLTGSKIVIGIFCITMRKAATGFEMLRDWIDTSPYFCETHPRQAPPKSIIKIPSKKIEVHLGSLGEHALGDNMYGFAVDEANFFKQQTGSTPDKDDQTRAHELYKQSKRRQTSRFGKAPGLITLISSQRTHTSFLEEREERGKIDNSIHTSKFSLWEVKPPDMYCGATFDVLIGDGRIASRILDEGEIPPKGYEVIRVPVEYWTEFDEDCEEALRDIAGKAVTGRGFFFPLRERLHLCVDRKRTHPFTKEVISALSSETLDSDLMEYLEVGKLFKTSRSRSVPLVNAWASRVGHVDIGLVDDALGLAVGHMTDTGQCYFDILLQVVPPKVGEVDLDAIVMFFKQLRRLGFHFSHLSYDQFQSKQSLQQLKKAGFNASKVSVGVAEYKALRRFIYSGPTACSYYAYPPFLKELIELQRGPDGGDPDHPAKGSKDIIDAAAAVASVLSVSAPTSVPGVTPRQTARAYAPVVGHI